MAPRPFQEGSWGGLGSSRGHLGGVLGRSWGLLGPIWAVLGLILDRLGVVRGVVLGLDSLNRFYASIESCDSTMRFVDAINGSFWVVLECDSLIQFIDSIYLSDSSIRFVHRIEVWFYIMSSTPIDSTTPPGGMHEAIK